MQMRFQSATSHRKQTNPVHEAWHLGPAIFHWSQNRGGNNAKWSSNRNFEINQYDCGKMGMNQTWIHTLPTQASNSSRAEYEHNNWAPATLLIVLKALLLNI